MKIVQTLQKNKRTKFNLYKGSYYIKLFLFIRTLKHVTLLLKDFERRDREKHRCESDKLSWLRIEQFWCMGWIPNKHWTMKFVISFKWLSFPYPGTGKQICTVTPHLWCYLQLRSKVLNGKGYPETSHHIHITFITVLFCFSFLYYW